MTSSLAASGAPRHLSQSVAQELDALLMAPLARGGAGFTNEQLMELSGLVTAQALLHAHPRARRVAVLVGPGNNGGDALVAARHLAHFRVHTEIHFPKRKSAADAPHIARLTEQCVALQLPFLDAVSAALLQTFDVVLDGIFGFSYTPSADGVVRAPFDGVIAAVNQCTVPVEWPPCVAWVVLVLHCTPLPHHTPVRPTIGVTRSAFAGAVHRRAVGLARRHGRRDARRALRHAREPDDAEALRAEARRRALSGRSIRAAEHCRRGSVVRRAACVRRVGGQQATLTDLHRKV